MTKRMMAWILAVALLVCGMQTQVFAETEADGEYGWEDVSQKHGLQPFTCMDPSEVLEAARLAGSVDPVGDDMTLGVGEFQGSLKEETWELVPEWERYGTKLVYNRLTKEERAFWDRLSELGYCFLLEGKDADVFSSWHVTEWVMYQGFGIERAQEIMYLFLVSNPQFYFFQTACFPREQTDTSGYLMLLLYDQFAEGSKRAEVTEEFSQKIESWVGQVNQKETDLEKEIAIHDLICNKVDYDDDSNNILEDQTAYSVFFTDVTVCAGYSQAMQLMCNAVGIPCASVVNAVHQWNLVCINDTWYYTDLTWDDDAKGPLYRYFNRSMDMLLALEDGMAGNQGESHIPYDYMEQYLPASTKDSGADWDNAGTVYVPEEQTASPELVIEDGKVSISQPTEADIYYTVDGGEPSVAASKSFYYTDGFAVEAGTVVSAMAAQDGYWDSEVVSVKWTEPDPKPDPDPTPEPKPDSTQGLDSGASSAPKPSPENTDVTPQAEVHNVKLNANGGYIGKKSVKSKEMKVISGDTYGKLPSAKKKGYAFLGWFTQKKGGSRITAEDTAALTGDTVLYARFCKVAPKRAAIASLKSSASGKMLLRIKDSKIASGYQIRYSEKASMRSAKTVKTEACEKQIAKLKKGRKYYVQVRMYQKDSVSGKISYGAWSKKARIKIQK